MSLKNRKSISSILSVLLLVGVAIAPLGCESNSVENAANETGDALEEAADATGEAIEEAVDEAQDAGNEVADEVDDATNQ